MHAKIENNAVVEYPIFNLRQRLPNISLPEDLTANLPEGFVYVHSAVLPPYNPATQTVVQSTSPAFDGAKWVLEYEVVDLTESEIAERYKASIPQVVTMRQARLALLGAGLLDAVETAIAGAGPASKIEWDYATEVQRSAGLVPAMATALGMTEAKIDALFVAAAAL